MNKIESLKAGGRYELAGQVARLLGLTDAYGCHYGMKSEREAAIAYYKQGWASMDLAINTAGIDIVKKV